MLFGSSFYLSDDWAAAKSTSRATFFVIDPSRADGTALLHSGPIFRKIGVPSSRRSSRWENPPGAGGGPMSAYILLAKKAYRRNLQYRAAHMVNNAGSMIFGLIYIAIWQAAARGSEAGPYDAPTLAWWVAFNQVMPVGGGLSPLWAWHPRERCGQAPSAWRCSARSTFICSSSPGSWARSGTISGSERCLWRSSLPWPSGCTCPKNPATYPLLLCGIVLAVYIGLCQQYLVGISAFWTVESRWAWQLTNTLQIVLSGFMVPIDLLPAPFNHVARVLPFAPLHHDPASIYLELAGAEALRGPSLGPSL